ncbi:MAG: hypothetical protein JW940_26385 [Polyangiaceae bacterium]|nr:hypothetical protein [Polyangiaceae bacterium]
MSIERPLLRFSQVTWAAWLVACGTTQTKPTAAPVGSNEDPTLVAALDAGSQGPNMLLGPRATPESDDPETWTDEPDPGELAADPTTGLVLQVYESGPDLPWKLRVFNAGARSVRVVADPRLLWFSVQAPGKKKSLTCRLPAELFPNEPERRLLVWLEPGEGLADRFDPRLYCFAADGQRGLVPGALIEPHFGWPPAPDKVVWRHGRRDHAPVKQKPPFVAVAFAEEADEEEPGADVADCTKELRARPFSLRSEYATWSLRGLTEVAQAHGAEGPLTFKIAQGSDARAERSATVRLRLKNRSKHKTRVFFRRELVTFEVTGTDGTSTCSPAPDDRAPDAQEYLTLAAGQSMDFTCELAELCPRGTFGRPGLYLVHARFDAADDGEEAGLHAFTGTVATPEPGAVRIRTGEMPFLSRHPMHRFGRDAHGRDRSRERAPGDAGPEQEPAPSTEAKEPASPPPSNEPPTDEP